MGEPAKSAESDEVTKWTFLTNHASVLLAIARDPDVRLRDIAAEVGITERATQRIVAELEDAGYLERTRIGRRNSYLLDTSRRMRHPLWRDHQVGELLSIVTEK